MEGKYFNTEDVIKDLLYLNPYPFESDHHMRVVFIDLSYLAKWREWIKKRFGDDCFKDMGPYKLRINENSYDVHLVGITLTERLFLGRYLLFPWNDNITIFTDLECFSRLKEVIIRNDVEKNVQSIQTWREINSSNKTIKIVTLRLKTINMPTDLKKLIRMNPEPTTQFELMAWAFPWFVSSHLPLFDKQSVNNEFFVGLITYLQLQRELCYDMKSEFTLNVIELCALKLAFCPEFGFEPKACTELAHEIDHLIINSLDRLAKNNSNEYLSDNHFNLIQYAYDRDFDLYAQELAIWYFIYNFQDWFKCITIPSTFRPIHIHLVKEHKFALARLNRFKRRVIIDGTGFSDMNFELFAGYLETGNVSQIKVDTNYRWSNANERKYLPNYTRNILIQFIGGNTFKFIEDFIECLKFSIPCYNKHFKLRFINPNIKSFLIFKNLLVGRITFENLTLTSLILNELIACENNIKNQFEFNYCKIVDDAQPWTLLNELNCYKVLIIEEEKTWQNLYDSIVNQMKETNSNEFKLKFKIEIIIQNGRIIELNRLKFTIDEFESRLNIRDRQTNEILDLFDLKMDDEYSGDEDSEIEDSEDEDSEDEDSEEYR